MSYGLGVEMDPNTAWKTECDVSAAFTTSAGDRSNQNTVYWMISAGSVSNGAAAPGKSPRDVLPVGAGDRRATGREPGHEGHRRGRTVEATWHPLPVVATAGVILAAAGCEIGGHRGKIGGLRGAGFGLRKRAEALKVATLVDPTTSEKGTRWRRRRAKTIAERFGL